MITLQVPVGYTPYNIMPRHLRKFRELNAQIRQRNLKQEGEQRPPSSSSNAQQLATRNQQLGENNQDGSNSGIVDSGEE